MAAIAKDTMYSCNICGKVFLLQTMYACYHGHYLCSKCYKNVYYKGKEKKCPHGTCNAYIVRGGEASKGEPLERSKMMFPNPCIYSQVFATAQPSISLTSMYGRPSTMSITTLSKKPIQCPHHGCHKTIAVSSLDFHFEHDHKHVMSIVTTLETRNGLQFNFKDLQGFVKTLCLVLIIIDERCMAVPNYSNYNIQRSPQNSKTSVILPPKPFFVVMAAKVTASDYVIEEDDEEEEVPDCGFSPFDKIIFFVTSNIVTNYSYTIAVSTADEMIRLKYYGPLLTMNDDHKKLYNDGKGLILNHYHVDGMSDHGKKDVKLDIVIHEREDENYESD